MFLFLKYFSLLQKGPFLTRKVRYKLERREEVAGGAATGIPGPWQPRASLDHGPGSAHRRADQVPARRRALWIAQSHPKSCPVI